MALASSSDPNLLLLSDTLSTQDSSLSEKLPKALELWKEADWADVRRWRRILLILAVIKMLLAVVVLTLTSNIKQGHNNIVISIAPVINAVVWFALVSSGVLLFLEITCMTLLANHQYFGERRLSHGNRKVHKSKAALWVYATSQNVLLAIFAGVFLVSIVGEYGIYNEQSMQHFFKHKYSQAFENPGNPGDELEPIHNNLKCCGYYGYKDWVDNETIIKLDKRLISLQWDPMCHHSAGLQCCVPQSCCKVLTEENCAICIASTNFPNMGKIHTTGCFHAFKSYVLTSMTTTGVLMICQCAFCMLSLVALWFSNRNLRLLSAIKLLEERKKKEPDGSKIYGKHPDSSWVFLDTSVSPASSLIEETETIQANILNNPPEGGRLQMESINSSQNGSDIARKSSSSSDTGGDNRSDINLSQSKDERETI